jgi:hypothetical protein
MSKGKIVPESTVFFGVLPKSPIVISLVLATFAFTFIQSAQADMVTDWNAIATTAAAAPIKNGVVQTRIYAMTHAAVHDALNAIDRRYRPYLLDMQALNASPAAAVAAAAAIIALRSSDGSDAPMPYTPGNGPGVWIPTPPDFLPASVPGWGSVTPFTGGANEVPAAVLQALARAHSASASAVGARTDLLPATRRELAQARRATAKYHDVANALADGYVDANLYTSGEGYHFVNPLLIDTSFDPEKPEVLLYANHPGEDGLKLVAVEYLSPDAFPAPAGFTGDADVWQLEPPFPIWVVNAWIWLNNPNGVFTFLNPRVP